VTFVTPQQLEVWRLVAEGRSTKEICAALQVCRQTVDKHRGALYEALGVHTPAELVRRAVEHQVVHVARRPLIPHRNGKYLRWVVPR